MAQLLSAFLLLVLLTGSFPAYSQAPPSLAAEEKEPWSYGVNGYYGGYFRYRAGMPLLKYAHVTGVELYAHRHTLGKRFWERKYKLPQIGVALSYFDYRHPEELGISVEAATYLDGPITRIGKGTLRYNLGTGLVYSSRYYTPGTNEGNKAIGSPVTFSLRGNLRYEHPLTQHWFLNVQLAFRHFSNGSLNQSNNGMNMPLLGLGIRYQPSPIHVIARKDSLQPALDKRVKLNMRVAAGVKEVLREDTKHPVYVVSGYASKRVSYTNSFQLGLDALHDTAIREEYVNQGLAVPEGVLDKRSAGVFVGHELHLNQLSVVVQAGRYLYQPHHLFPDFYQRYGLKFMVTRNLSASALLMAHSGHANVIEWGLGVHL